MKRYTVQVSKWLRGGRDPHGAIYGSTLWSIHADAGCCLGHIGRQCGLSVYDLHNRLYPNTKPLWPKELFSVANYSTLYHRMAATNDDHALDDQNRALQLMWLARSEGIDLTFIP